MSGKKLFVFVLAFTLLALLASACAPAPAVVKETVVVEKIVTKEIEVEKEVIVEKEVVVAPTPAPIAAPRYGGTVVEALPATIKSFNPWSTVQNEWKRMQKRVLGRIAWIDPEGKLVPDLAESWDISDDSTVYTFYLRSGVTWHDGEEFTAEDVKFTLETSAIPEYGSGFRATSQLIKGTEAFVNGEADSIEGITILDENTIQIELASPSGSFLYNLAFYANIAPEHIFEGVAPEDVPKQEYCTTKPIGTGPWMVENYVPDQTIELVRNENYWEEDLPYIDRYIYKTYTNYSAALAALEAGEVDIAEVRPADIEHIKGVPYLEIFDFWKGGIQLLFVNQANEALSDERVRQAMAYAIDREGLVAGPWLGLGAPAYHSLPVNYSWSWNPHIVEYKYNPEKARELLEEAGYDTSQTLKMVTYYQSEEVDAIQALLETSGFKVDVQKMDSPAYLEVYRAGDYDIAYAATFNRPDPDMSTVNWLCDGAENYYNYCNPRVDELVIAGGQTADMEERQDIYQELDLLLNEDLPYIPMATVKLTFGYNQRIANFQYERIYWDYAERWYVFE